jgi:threonine dehydrogenase-like Zn-dependent dehydrogenase
VVSGLQMLFNCWLFAQILLALVEPLTVAWHAVCSAPIEADDSALVIGAGPIGICVVQALKAKGIRNIVVSEVSEFRRDLLTEHFGPVQVLDPSDGNGVENCKNFCGGDGPAVVFDAAGVQAGLDLALAASRVGATIVNIAEWKTPASVDMMLLVLGEKRYTSSMVYVKKDFEEVLVAMGNGRSRDTYTLGCSRR